MDLVSILFVLAASCACLCLFGRRIVRLLYLSSKIQGPSSWDILTKHVSKFLSDKMLTHACEICETYKYMPWGVWIYTDFVVVVSDPEMVKGVYKNLPNKTPLLYETAAKHIGDGLFNLNGEDSKRHRRIILPSFRKCLVESRLPQVNKTAGKLVEDMQDIVGKSIDLEKMIEDAILDLAFWTLTSGVYSNRNCRGVCRAFHGIMNSVQLRTMNPLYYWLVHRWKKSSRDSEIAMKTLMLEFKNVLDEEKWEFAKKIREYPDLEPANLFEFMLYATLGVGEEEFSEDEFLTDCLTLVIAAFETTSFTIHVCLLLIAAHPDVQQRVFEEQDAIFGQSDREVEIEDLSKMIYLGYVLKETLRLFPPAPVIGKVVEEEININGLLLPKGCSVLINNMALNRNPDHFQEPLKFDPDRFSSAGSQGLHQFAFNPFSYGVRNCPGQFQGYMVMKTVLSYVIRNFMILPGEGFNGVENIKVKMTVSLHLRRPIELRLIARKRCKQRSDCSCELR